MKALALLSLLLIACGGPVAGTARPVASTTGSSLRVPLVVSASPPPAKASLDIDLGKVREPDLVWSFPSEDREPFLLPGGVLVVDEGAASLSLVAAKTGERVWRVPAPAGVTFSSIVRLGETTSVLVNGFSSKGSTLSRVDAAHGKLVWHRKGVGEPIVGAEGTAAVTSVGGCASAVLDLETGASSTTSIPDTLTEMMGHDGGSPQTMCQRATWPLVARGGVTLVSSGGKGRDETLQGFGKNGRTKYSVPIGAAHARFVHAGPTEVALLLLGEQTTFLRMSVATGKEIARSVLTPATSCATDETGPYAEVMLDDAGNATSMFARVCGHAMLVDLVSGWTNWDVPVGEDVAFLIGAKTTPWDKPAQVVVSGSHAEQARLLDKTGKVVSTIALPEEARDVMPLAGGVVVTNDGLDRTTFYDEKGLRWRLLLAFGNSFPLGDHYVVLGSKAAAQVVIDPHDGFTFVTRGDSPWSVGVVDGLWITTRHDPTSLIATRTR